MTFSVDDWINEARNANILEVAGLPKTAAEARASGSRFYFTGKPCPKGHVTERITSTNVCKGCHDAWRPAKEKRRAYERAKYHADLEKSREKNRLKEVERRKRDGDRIREQERARRKAFKEEKPDEWRKMKRESARREREKNPERAKEKSRAQWLANRDRYLAHTRCYRARKRKAEGTHTAEDVAEIRAAQKDKCAACRKALRGKGHVDHIIALSKGGSNWPSNLQLLCAPCNLAKNNRDPIEFMQDLGRLL